MNKYVKVPLSIYIDLETDSAELAELESLGVDNWPGYEECSSREDLEITEEEISYEIIEE